MNKVILIGGIGGDLELKHTKSGAPVVNFSLATNRWNSLTKETETVWHSIVLWGKSAESFSQHAGKGSRVAVEGEIKYGSYVDKQGVEKHKTEIHCFASPEIIAGFKKSDGSQHNLVENSFDVDDPLLNVPF